MDCKNFQNMEHIPPYFKAIKPEELNRQEGDFNTLKKEQGPVNKINEGIVFLLISFCFLFILFGYVLFSAPTSFNVVEIINVKSGMSVKETGSLLKDKNIIRSPFSFRLATALYGGRGGVIAGKYKFEEPMSVFGVASKLTKTGYGVTVLKVTVPEGLSNKEIASLLSKNFDNFDSKKFISLAKDKEGYLFPDTYFFELETTPEQVIEMMNANFKNKIKGVNIKIALSGKNLHEILTMASIIEDEARTEETRKMISGILWKRIDAGMMLQVDVSFVYLLGKGSAQLSLADLQIDSPYNTYKYKGLPPGPITNPGLGAILAALEPTSNPYWFYLSDKEGNMHYAETFEGHKANKFKYLR